MSFDFMNLKRLPLSPSSGECFLFFFSLGGGETERDGDLLGVLPGVTGGERERDESDLLRERDLDRDESLLLLSGAVFFTGEIDLEMLRCCRCRRLPRSTAGFGGSSSWFDGGGGCTFSSAAPFWLA
jgi:hypothetical protein